MLQISISRMDSGDMVLKKFPTERNIILKIEFCPVLLSPLFRPILRKIAKNPESRRSMPGLPEKQEISSYPVSQAVHKDPESHLLSL